MSLCVLFNRPTNFFVTDLHWELRQHDDSPEYVGPFFAVDAVMSCFMQTFCVRRASPVQPGIPPIIARNQHGHRESQCSSPRRDHLAAGPFGREPGAGHPGRR